MILPDTMMLSELRKARPNTSVITYLNAQLPNTVFLSAMTVGEIGAGVEKQRDIFSRVRRTVSTVVDVDGIAVCPTHPARHARHRQAVGTAVLSNWQQRH